MQSLATGQPAAGALRAQEAAGIQQAANCRLLSSAEALRDTAFTEWLLMC